MEHRFGRDIHRARMARAEARDLFGWPQLNAALAEHRLTAPRLRLERAGADVTRDVFRERRTRRGALLDLDAAALTQNLRDGATLIVDSANELSPSLQRLCSGLAAEFLASCQANLYACWGATPGFDVHWDDHEVFVVQVEGRKRWALYGSTRAWPLRRDAGAEHPRPQTPILELVLEPGDVLYLPRGYWHAAVGQGEPSLHLTIGLTRKTGSDLVHWLAEQLIAETVVRADLPFERDDAALGRQVADVLAAVAARDPHELGRLYRRHLEASQAHRPALSFPYIGQPGDEGVAAVRLAAGAARLEPAASAGAVVLHWRGAAFTVDAGLEAPLRTLLAGGSVTVAALAEASRVSTEDAGEFVTAMAQRGVFVVSVESAL
jgi:hypothetical protein